MQDGTDTAHKRLKDVATRCVLRAVKASTVKMRVRPGLCPGPRWGSLQRSPDPLAGFGEKEWGREGREGGGKAGRERREREGEEKVEVVKLEQFWYGLDCIMVAMNQVHSCRVFSKTSAIFSVTPKLGHYLRESLADAKVSVRQKCVYEDP